MSKYELEVSRTIFGTEYATVVVEANNEEDAEEMVWDECIDWEPGRHGYDYDGYEITTCQRIGGSTPIKGIKPVSKDVQDKANQLLAGLKRKE